jgi:hypothetical protein
VADRPCPLCDIERGDIGSVDAFALGVGLGSAFADIHAVTELTCATHRFRYVTAMVHASIAMNEVEAAEGTT